MNSIVASIEDIKKELKIDSQGRGYASIRGTARLSGVSHQNLSNRFTSGNFIDSKLGKILTEHGFNPCNFSKDGVPDIAVSLIVEYYAFQAGGRCTEQAKKIHRAYAAIGVRSWMQNLLGWQQPKQQIKIKEADRVIEISLIAESILKRMGDTRSARRLINELVDSNYPSRYKSAQKKIESKPNYLVQFCNDCGLVELKYGAIAVAKIWYKLQDWYFDNGYMEIEVNDNGQYVNVWKTDEDVIKGTNQIPTKLKKVFPKLKRVKKSDGVYLIGIGLEE